MRCAMGDATHAVVGTTAPTEDKPQGTGGVICWHDNELEAHRERKEINEAGGSVRVIEAPGGEMDPEGVLEAYETALNALEVGDFL